MEWKTKYKLEKKGVKLDAKAIRKLLEEEPKLTIREFKLRYGMK